VCSFYSFFSFSKIVLASSIASKAPFRTLSMSISLFCSNGFSESINAVKPPDIKETEVINFALDVLLESIISFKLFDNDLILSFSKLIVNGECPKSFLIFLIVCKSFSLISDISPSDYAIIIRPEKVPKGPLKSNICFFCFFVPISFMLNNFSNKKSK
jgi:hypothetical protein